MFTVYALRELGSAVPRYIGQTRHTPEHRLMGHMTEASEWRRRTPFRVWLLENRASIVAVALDTFPTRDEAKAAERLLIRSCARLGCHLFNRDHVPAEHKMALAA